MNSNDQDINSNYIFLSWFKQGMSTIIDTCSQNGRAKLKLKLKINDNDIDKDIELIGPKDIKGINEKVITRIDPKNNIGDFEPNYFPIIEFSEADFPWRYTPIPPDGNDNHRLKPWICLIVLKTKDNTKNESTEEFEVESLGTSNTLPSIKVKRGEKNRYPLPDLDEIWAWAHVQITTNKNRINDNDLKSIITDHPEQILSRIICPRKLDPETLYNAFLVPTFKAGINAGLGFQNDDPTGSDKAWNVVDTGNSEIEIPYYYKWEFRTGMRGDFEHLVRLLEARNIDKRVGTRQMDCENRINSLPPVTVNSSHILGDDLKSDLRLEGALRAVSSEITVWPKDASDGVQKSYTDLLNLPDIQIKESPTEIQKLIVVPPIYGKWHAMRNNLIAEDRPWINQLNLDPRYRTIASFGTSVIQEHQDSLMHSAWKQIGEIEEANELLRISQLGQIVSTKIYEKNIKPLSTNTLLGMSYPLLPRIIYDKSEIEKSTLNEKIKSSRIMPVLDPAFLKIIRGRGPIKKRTKAEKQKGSYIDRINKGEINGNEETKSHPPSLKDTSEKYRPTWAKGLLWKCLKPLWKILSLLAIILTLILWVLSQFGIIVPSDHPIIVIPGIVLIVFGFSIRRYAVPGIIADNIIEEKLTPEFIASIPPRSDFVINDFGDNVVSNTGRTDSADAIVFRSYATNVQEFLSFVPPDPPELEELDLTKIQGVIIDAINPKITIINRIKKRFVSDLIKFDNDQIVFPMAAPIFEQPMYIPLRDKSHELLLPGLEYVPQNTIGLLLENRKFIESYMCGCSHEMARELLWREYPTDQRGTYFRQFWDTSGTIKSHNITEQLRNIIIERSDGLPDEDHETYNEIISEKIEKIWKENLLDIEKIHLWKNTDLGNNPSNRIDAINENNSISDTNENKLVLLIRGDLLKKYPTAVIYTNKAKWIQKSTKRWPSNFPENNNIPNFLENNNISNSEEDKNDINNIKMPIFQGTLPPDMTFLGFELTEEQAKGSTKSGKDPGWFFIIEERISESRFGIDMSKVDDEVKDWDDLDDWDALSWDHLDKKLINHDADPTDMYD